MITRLAGSEADRAILAISERLALHRDAVDPGFQLARDREIIEPGANHDDICIEELLHVLAAVQRQEDIERHMRDRVGREVTVGDVQGRVGFPEALDHGGGDGAARRSLAHDAGVEVKKLH